MNKADKTKQKTGDALIKMLQRHPIDRITIKELTENAGVGRTAFYNNFSSLEDVLKYVYQKAHKAAFHNKYEDEHYIFSKQYVRDMIAFFDANSDLMEALFRWHLIDTIARYNTELCISYAKEYETDEVKEKPLLATIYTASSLFNTCTWWVVSGKSQTPEELYNLIMKYRHMMEP